MGRHWLLLKTLHFGASLVALSPDPVVVGPSLVAFRPEPRDGVLSPSKIFPELHDGVLSLGEIFPELLAFLFFVPVCGPVWHY